MTHSSNDPPGHVSTWWWVTGLLGATGVALGAFGAHGLRNWVDDPALVQTWETAARYHQLHALATGLVALHPWQPRNAGLMFLVGVLLFSGSLYAIVLSGARWLGAITPVGGLFLIGGWIALAWAAWPLRANR